jgi:hypothetical protein
MRVRVLHSGTSEHESIDLSAFRPGRIYEVEPFVATYLVVSGLAEPCDGTSPALVVCAEDVTGVGVFVGPTPCAAVADDSDDVDGDKPTASVKRTV